MSVAGLSNSAQNHLKTIWSLTEWSDEPVTPSSIAERTGLKLSTVSEAVRKLAEAGYVEHARYGSVALTERGRSSALAVVRRHRLLETFLVAVLHYRWDQVHDEAEVLEHAVSDLLVERIDELLGRPERDPHGDPIPSAAGEVRRPAAGRLTAAAPGARVRVVRIADDDPARLQYFADHGLVVDAELHVLAAEPYSEALTVRVGSDGEPVVLGAGATDSVWVSTGR